MYLLPESNPENVIEAPVGSVFTRFGEEFYLIANGNRSRLEIPKKSFGLSQNPLIFENIDEEIIGFETPGETWRKASGRDKTGWKRVSSSSTSVASLIFPPTSTPTPTPSFAQSQTPTPTPTQTPTPSAALSYVLTSGNLSPVYGASPASYPPEEDWVGLFEGAGDDEFIEISFPFDYYHAGNAYTASYVCSNTYMTFGSGEYVYEDLGLTNPALPKFMFGSGNNSYQTISTYTHPDDHYVAIRYEGDEPSYGTDPGDSGIIMEIRMFNPEFVEGRSVVEVLVGFHNGTAGVFEVDDGSSTIYDSGSIQANTSYVFYGNSDGTSYTRYDNYYMNPSVASAPPAPTPTPTPTPSPFPESYLYPSSSIILSNEYPQPFDIYITDSYVDHFAVDYDFTGNIEIFSTNTYVNTAAAMDIVVYPCKSGTDSEPSGSFSGTFLANTPVKRIIFKDCLNLVNAYSNSSELNEFDVSGAPNLSLLNIDGSSLTQIDLSQNPNLQTFEAQNSKLSSLDLSNSVSMSYLNIEATKIKTIDFTGAQNLVTLIAGYSNISSSIDLSNNHIIENITVGGIYNRYSLSTLILPTEASSSLTTFRIDGKTTFLTYDFSPFENLNQVWINYSNFTSVDLSQQINKNFSNLYIYNNPNLTSANLSTINPAGIFTIANNDYLTYVNVSGSIIATDVSKLNQLYSDLPTANPTASATLELGPISNTGSLSTATAKNWTVNYTLV